MKKILYINACLNRATSRTYRISEALISLLKGNGEYDLAELILEDEYIPALTSDTLNRRLELTNRKDFSDKIFDYAKQFKEADCIVVAAPYWDFGFPSILKTYIEAIGVPGIAYAYGEGGRPVGQCKAEKLYYVTTRGGFIGDDKDLGYLTMVQLGAYYGIKEVKCISMDAFDIPTNNPDEFVKTAIESLRNCVQL